MNLLKLPAFGHAQSVNPHGIENIVAAGLGYEAHVSNPQHAAQDVIDRGQQVESNVQQTGAELIHTVTPGIQHSISAAGHTWTQTETRAVELTHIAIPWLEGSLVSG